jgi:Low affinity iron permease
MRDQPTEAVAAVAGARTLPTVPKLEVLRHATEGGLVRSPGRRHLTGRPATFLLAVAVVIVWAVTGPLFGFGDTWQLVINTGTTIVTFLMVFLIQAT